MTNKNYLMKYLSELKYIENMINYCKERKYKLVVVTHYPPTFKTLDGVNRKTKFLSLYASNLEYLLDKNKIHTWIYGHTHKSLDIISPGGTRIVSNQKGTVKSLDETFSKDFVIKIL